MMSEVDTYRQRFMAGTMGRKSRISYSIMFVGQWAQEYKICFDSSQETWKCAAGRLHGPHVGSVTNHQRVCLGTGHDKGTSGPGIHTV